MCPRVLLLAVLPALPLAVSAAQTWNTPAAVDLAQRAIARRTRAAADTALRDYKAQAHGFLFFLGQFGEGLADPPRLVKADQLELEVYWKAPASSKQRVVGWRDRAELPTDINYHRDHLGIVQNNFGAAIRLGEGDEVRDVPHPLSAAGPDLYDYALADSTTITFPQREVRVVALRVRPKNFDAPRIVGTLYVDAATADLVRLAFNFTPRAYLDAQLEDVSIVLDNALWEGRFWLPYRQELEIRRRATWLDVPARGIIHARWDIEGYVFNLGLAASWFQGDEITFLPKAERDSFPWPEPLTEAIQTVAEPVRQSDLERVRAEVEQIAGRRALTGLKARRLGVRGLSDLVRANRVEGLTLGAGLVWRGGGERRELRVIASYGFSDRRPKGSVAAVDREGRGALEASLFREVRDVGDERVIAPLLNSFASQEFGADYGDYYLADGARLTYRHGSGVRGEWSAALGRETIRSLAVTAEPANGSFRPNPALGGGGGETGVDLAQLALRRRSEGFAVRRDLHYELVAETGRADGGNTYLRVSGTGHLLLPAGATRLLVRALGGVATRALPAHRSFVLGGRGTLLGDDFRRWGGGRMALAHLEWRVPVPFVSLRLGPYTRTPGQLTVAPYVAAGWADRPVPGTPWVATPGTRVTLGLGLEWLGVFRFEAGVGAEGRRIGFALDVTRDFWGIL
ncbi:MAG: hypothetical protein AUH78_26410 [Gemmatimonadetes bacterium 13_1_40CM_4_69_8]|nr:MAG: hypothetical protein AUH45_06895 [Gemmatimonadetes bacterium 13_1_40CM_69_22]OLC68240.1 MAG: hypothetical protein AUH78_26410 [Gemmatimonadetes bacterium 13_1_40CM_4_69_8]